MRNRYYSDINGDVYEYDRLREERSTSATHTNQMMIYDQMRRIASVNYSASDMNSINLLDDEDDDEYIDIIQNDEVKIGSSVEIKKEPKKPKPTRLRLCDNKFVTTVGIEFSLFTPEFVNYEEIKEHIEECNDFPKWIKDKVDTDGESVIEMPTLPMTKYKELRKVWRELAVVKNSYPTEYVCPHTYNSGGGHIHMGIPITWDAEFLKDFLLNLYNYIGHRPYLNWIFNEPNDECNANSMLNTTEDISIESRTEMYRAAYYERFTRRKNAAYDSAIQQYIRKKYPHKTKGRVKLSMLDIINLDPTREISKLYNVVYRSGSSEIDGYKDTVEFRLFNMVRSYRELKANVDFAQAVYAHAFNMTLKGDKFRTKLKKIPKYKMSKYVELFKNDLKELKLKYSEYKPYVDDYLTTRFEFGKDYLK